MFSKLSIKYRIPSIIVLFSSLLFVFMALGKSQYQLFSDLYKIVGDDPFSSLNRPYTLGGLFTIFTILFLVFVILLDFVSFFFDRLFNYHTIHKMLFALIVLETISEILAFSMVYQTRDNALSFYSAFNLFSLILTLIVSVSYVVTEILFVAIPYYRLKKEIDKEESEKKEEKHLFIANEEETKKEEKKNTKAEMLKMVTALLDEKKISKEEADKMIERITKDE